MKEYKSFYKTVDGNEGQKCHYPTRLDTYGCGCQHDCKYCYAKSLLSFRNLWDNMSPSVANVSKIKNKIKTLEKGIIVRLGGMTDCFQPCERQHRVTYETIKCLNQFGIHYLIVTKSDMVADDEYIEIMDKSLAHIQITVTSTDDKIAMQYEKATPSSKRIQAIEKLERLGFDVQMRISPFIPEYIDMDVIKEVKCKRVIVEFLRVNSFIKRTFDLDYSAYNYTEGGYQHLSLETKKQWINQILATKEVSVCEDCNDAYEYWQKYVNPFPEDCCNLRFGNEVKYMGNMDLLRCDKTAFLSSSQVADGTKEKIDHWLDIMELNDVCIISGFQSEMEKRVLDRLLSSKAKIIMVLAKKVFTNCPSRYKKAIEQGRMLIISPYKEVANFTTKEAAKKRNQYVVNHASRIVVGYISKGGMLDNILKECSSQVKALS